MSLRPTHPALLLLLALPACGAATAADDTREADAGPLVAVPAQTEVAHVPARARDVYTRPSAVRAMVARTPASEP